MINEANLYISANQAAGECEYLQRSNYAWDYSQEEPGLWPLEEYDAHANNPALQMMKQLNEFIRTDDAAQQFDGAKVSVDLNIPEGFPYDEAKKVFEIRGFTCPTIANFFSGKSKLTVQWTNFVVPESAQAVLEGSKRLWDSSTDAGM